MSSIYSSNRSSRRISHAAGVPDSPVRHRTSRPNRTSDIIPDLSNYTSWLAIDSAVPGPRLWERRKSSKSVDGDPVPPIEAFNLDLVEAYEEAEDEAYPLSPAMSDRPPRSSSLAQNVSSNRSLSLDQDFSRGPAVAVRRPQKGTFLNQDPSRQTYQKKHRRHMTISETKKANRNTVIVSHPTTGLTEHDLPPLPGLSPSNSTTTSVPSLTPTTPISVFAPTEDQIRRELEMMSLSGGAEPLIHHRYGGRTNSDLIRELENEVESAVPRHTHKRQSSRAEPDATEDPHSPEQAQLRRRKSIIEYFRKSPVDRLLDLYLDDDPSQADKKPPDKQHAFGHKRRPSLARRVTMSLRHSKEKMPEVPPLPTGLPLAGVSQSHFDFD
ncbi:uncharacterized protein AB675_2494 [Cyphellophora attinorum]|uniref:Uncharacterized protein n=1 Tax=Cyphellophora attinorum TaxID=1664694 RepID=A0A0N1HAH7_9EURO|nr:uncharacterized protein AB675_2494 [Phialophora attinorum]KPI44955.1 hypothetical protein AB675_2494 [Phialophora attinorum]